MSTITIIPATGANSGSVQQLWDALQKDGAVVSNSPKNRARLYKRLQESGISYKTEVIGYTTDSEEQWVRTGVIVAISGGI